MASHTVKTAWVHTGTNNAANLGLDEIIQVDDFYFALDACVQAAQDMADHREKDFATGKYDIIAECVNKGVLYRLTKDEYQ